ncbi:hypothetical protein ACHAWF_013066 [Thalassiosira exigua]
MAAASLARCRRCPELIVSRTRRSVRIVSAACLFAASYLLLLDPGGDDVRLRRTTTGPYYAPPSSSDESDRRPPPPDDDAKVRIFYNLFTKGPDDEARVRRIVEEQLSLLDPSRHDATNVSVTSLGHPHASLPPGARIRERLDAGGEEVTLRAVWDHCRSNPRPDAKVAYLHSKGSYHPTSANVRLRAFATSGALSSECASLPPTCDVCSSRMSPLPHPHGSGNMWLARCDYVARLFDPASPPRMAGERSKELDGDDPCAGTGRYLSEHWVHSHPSVRPCDLYPGKEFTWAHLHVPGRGWKKELEAAPRFDFDAYVLPGSCMDERPETLRILDFVRMRREGYERWYNLTDLDEAWWGWDFLRRSIDGG